MRLITSWFSTILLLLIMLLSLPLQAATQPNEAQLRKELKQAEANKGMANQAEIVQALQGALSWLADAKESDIRTQQYQKAIDNFPKLTRELRQQLAQENGNPLPVPDNMSTSELEFTQPITATTVRSSTNFGRNQHSRSGTKQFVHTSSTGTACVIAGGGHCAQS